jgi:hypothetical protein
MTNSQSVMSGNVQELEQKLGQKLFKTLRRINFDKKYYGYCESHSDRTEKSNLKLSDFESVLMSTSLNFKYDKREKFFGHKETLENHTIVFNIAFSSCRVEIILSIIVNESCTIGDPFSALARRVARLDDPNFEYSPRYPEFPFSNYLELQDAVNFGISLFEEIKQGLLVDKFFENSEC